jgi:hypothetical protein
MRLVWRRAEVKQLHDVCARKAIFLPMLFSYLFYVRSSKLQKVILPLSQTVRVSELCKCRLSKLNNYISILCTNDVSWNWPYVFCYWSLVGMTNYRYVYMTEFWATALGNLVVWRKSFPYFCFTPGAIHILINSSVIPYLLAARSRNALLNCLIFWFRACADDKLQQLQMNEACLGCILPILLPRSKLNKKFLEELITYYYMTWTV